MNSGKILLRIRKVQKIGGLILCPLILHGCCATPQTHCATMAPPTALLMRCEAPTVTTFRTNEDLIIYTSRLIEAFKVCAARVDAIRGYYDE